MILNTEKANTQSLLRDAYDVTSWCPESMLAILSEYIDSQGATLGLAHFINERVHFETGTLLYELNNVAECKQMGALVLSSESDDTENDFTLAPDHESVWITIRTADLYIYHHEEGIVIEVSSRDRPAEAPLGALSVGWDELVPKSMLVVEVHAQAIAHDIHEMDKHVSGVYHIALPLTLDNVSAGAALDVFHSSVPVKSLEDFSFTVFDRSGQELTEPDDYESYSHSSSGYLIRKS